MKSRRIRVALFVFFVVLGSLLWVRHTPEHVPPSVFAGLTMGTTFSITVADAKSPSRLDSVKPEVFALLDSINQKMSTYIPTSEITRFNNQHETGWFSVSPETAEVVDEAQAISRLTQGRFDITVGPLVDLWGFGPDPRRTTAPRTEEITQRLQSVGFSHLNVRLTPPALRKDIPSLRIDLSAIAKGYAVDQVGHLLLSRGYHNFIVEIGGEILAKGQKAPDSPWRIGIESPLTDRREVEGVLSVQDMAMATSGDYRNYFEEKGKRYSHTIDPKTGYPITHTLAAVTVLDKHCSRADALATSLMVMGPELGMAFCQEHRIAALFLIKTPSGFTERTTPAFDTLPH